MNSKLFEKSIDLKSQHIFGGRSGETWKECEETITDDNGCTYEITYTYDDKDNLLETCTTVTCPD